MNERQKPANSYARMFAAQKEKKAKEAKENEGKNAQNGDVNHTGRGAMEHLNSQVHPQVYMDNVNYGGHPGVGWPVDKGVHNNYDPSLGTYSERKCFATAAAAVCAVVVVVVVVVVYCLSVTP